MTAVAALVHNKKIYMGSDSAGVAGHSLTIRKDKKVFINGPFLIGFTSSFRMGQLLQYAFVPPKHPRNMCVEKYMATVFVDEVRKCMMIGKYSTGDVKQPCGNFLVGYKGKIYNIETDLQVGLSVFDFDAVGCGADLCLGSLHTTQNLDIDPTDKITMALIAAESFSSGVRGPFFILSNR